MKFFQKIGFYAASLVSLAIVSGCATPPAQNQDGAMKPSPPAPSHAVQPPGFQEQMAQLVKNDPLFAAMAAELAAQRGDLNSATIAYLETAKYLNDVELAKRAVELTLADNDAELALQAAQVWSELAPQDSQASRSVMLLQLSTNRVAEAMPAMKAYLNTLREQEENHPGITAASPMKATLDLLLRVPDKKKAYQTGITLISAQEDPIEAQFVLSQLADAADLPVQAIDHLQQVIDKVPEERYNVLMAQYMEKRDGNTKAAVEFLSGRADRHPDWFSARLYLARVFTTQNNWEAASDRFRELIRLQPTNYPLYSSQGFVLAKMGKRKDAERHFKIYLDKTPPAERQNELLIYISMADLYAADNRYADAMAWLNKAPNAGQDLDIQLKVHDVFRKQNRMREAAEVLERFKPQNEDDTVRLTLALSQFVEDLKQPAKAGKVLDKALVDYPDQPDLLYERAMVAERQKDLGSVERYLRRLIEVKPENPHGYNALGYTLTEFNVRLDEALTLIQKANELAPKDPYILDSLGWVYFKMGRLTEAEAPLTEAFKIRQDKEIGMHLIELYIKQGRKKDAERVIQVLSEKFPKSSELERLVQQANEIEL